MTRGNRHEEMGGTTGEMSTRAEQLPFPSGIISQRSARCRY